MPMVTKESIRVVWDFAKIRAEADKEVWVEIPDNPGMQSRGVHLGSWFSISPSGKIYTPFACSNVAGCDGCNGTGHTRSKYKRRVLKKWKARNKVRKRWIELYGSANEWPPHIRRKSDKLNALNLRSDPTCWRCGGMGSAEAHDDEVWRTYMEEALTAIGLFLDEQEGEVFASEVRDTPDEEERDGYVIDGEGVCGDCLNTEEPGEDPDYGFLGTAYVPGERFFCARCDRTFINTDGK